MKFCRHELTKGINEIQIRPIPSSSSKSKEYEIEITKSMPTWLKTQMSQMSSLFLAKSSLYACSSVEKAKTKFQNSAKYNHSRNVVYYPILHSDSFMS